MDEVAAALRPCLGSIIAITGHTDASGPEPGNLALSQERAEAVQAATQALPLQRVDCPDWAAGLGIDTFVGTSGRVFPAEMKAAPLLRAWLHRLRGQGLQLHMRHHWRGWVQDADVLDLHFDSPAGERRFWSLLVPEHDADGSIVGALSLATSADQSYFWRIRSPSVCKSRGKSAGTGATAMYDLYMGVSFIIGASLAVTCVCCARISG